MASHSLDKVLSGSVLLYAFNATEQLLAAGVCHSMLLTLLPNDLVPLVGDAHTPVRTSDMTSECGGFRQYFSAMHTREGSGSPSAPDLLLSVNCGGGWDGLVVHCDSDIPDLQRLWLDLSDRG